MANKTIWWHNTKTGDAYEVQLVDNGDGTYSPSSAPGLPIKEGGIVELIGINEKVDQNDFSEDVILALGASMSGEIIGVTLYMNEAGATGAVIAETGAIYFFDADPGIASGDTAFPSEAAAQKAIGAVSIAATDWHPAVGSDLVCTKAVAIPFHAVENLFAVYFHTGATSYNDGADDDELLNVNIWIRRDG